MSTEEEITIARVVLGGWRIEQTTWSMPRGAPQYFLRDPGGDLRSVHASRYTAALHAKKLMEAKVGIPA